MVNFGKFLSPGQHGKFWKQFGEICAPPNPDCIRKFINPSNTGAYAGCLKMKYDNSTTGGAESIRWKRPRRTCWRSRTACTRCRRR